MSVHKAIDVKHSVQCNFSRGGGGKRAWDRGDVGERVTFCGMCFRVAVMKSRECF